MPDFINYTSTDLEPADRIALAKALTTIYMEGVGSSPPNPNWNWRNLYTIGYMPNVRSFIAINAWEVQPDLPFRFMIFSVNTQLQAVKWKLGKNASNVTPVPADSQPFLRKLTDTVHDIAAKRTKALELKRKREEEERDEANISYEANKEKIDAQRELNRNLKVEKEENKRTEKAVKPAEEKLKEILLRRKDELDHAIRVLNWKASTAEASEANKTLTEAYEMLESAKRGPEHDLCEECGETLRFCAHEGCTIIGCTKCFEALLTTCGFCESFICIDHNCDFSHCSACEGLVCKSCKGDNCKALWTVFSVTIASNAFVTIEAFDSTTTIVSSIPEHSEGSREKNSMSVRPSAGRNSGSK